MEGIYREQEKIPAPYIIFSSESESDSVSGRPGLMGSRRPT
jgi:hypothetical protein